MYNNTIHTSTGHTPFYLDTGQHPLEPHDLQMQELRDNHALRYAPGRILNYNAEALQYIEDWKEALLVAKFKLQDAQSTMERWLNTKRIAADFKAGDQVWLDTSYISLPNSEGKLTDRTKFDQRRFGPYVILERLANGRAFKLELPPGQSFHPVQPISRLEPVKRSTRFPDAHRSIPPLPVCSEGMQQELEVGRITR